MCRDDALLRGSALRPLSLRAYKCLYARVQRSDVSSFFVARLYYIYLLILSVVIFATLCDVHISMDARTSDVIDVRATDMLFLGFRKKTAFS